MGESNGVWVTQGEDGLGEALWKLTPSPSVAPCVFQLGTLLIGHILSSSGGPPLKIKKASLTSTVVSFRIYTRFSSESLFSPGTGGQLNNSPSTL